MLRLILFLFLFVGQNLQSQITLPVKEKSNLYFKKYGILDGLPSNEAYYVHEDREGYIWVCTDNGMCRIDGVNFKHYTEKDGLCSNVVFGCKEDEKGKLWAYTYTGDITHYNRETDAFECPAFNDSLSKLLQGRIIQNILFNKDTLYVCTNSLYIKVYPGGAGTNFERRFAKKDVIECFVLSNKEILTLSGVTIVSKVFDFEVHGKTKFQFRGLSTPGTFNATLNGSLAENLYVFCGDNLLALNLETGKLLLSRLPFSSTPSLKKLGSVFLMGSYNNGMWALNAKNNQPFLEHFLGAKNVSCIEVDKQGGLWVSSQTDGLYYLPSLSVAYHPGSESGESEKIVSMIVADNKLYYTNYSGTLFLLSGQDAVTQTVIKRFGFQSPIIRSQNKDELFMNLGEYITYNLKTGKRTKSSLSELACAKNEKSGKQSMFASRDTLFMFSCTSSGPKAIPIVPNWRQGRIYFSAFSENNTLYVGTMHDVFSIDTSRSGIQRLSVLNRMKRLNGRYLIPLGKDSILVASSNGLHLFVKNLLVRSITDVHGLSSNKVLYLLKAENVLWVATSKGIDKVEGLISSGPLRITCLNRTLGLPYFQVSQLSMCNNRLYAATSLGLFSFDISDAKKPPAVERPEFKELLINNTSKFTDLSTPLKFRHDQNQFDISFNYFDFRNFFRNQFRYRLVSQHIPEWSYTSQNTIHFPILSPGEYKLELEALESNGVWVHTASPLVFTIKKPFTKSTSFIAFMLLLVLTTFIVVFRYRLKQIKRISLLKEKVYENRMLALTMQLNPHFVFNALNSVSFHIAQNNAKSALAYLGRFARLMRYIFKNSQQTFISLEEELKSLNLYIELETVRLGKGFTYSIVVETEIQPGECKLPALLLQPLVENALWHGIGSLEEGGNLNITFVKEGGTLVVEIVDNGYGKRSASSPNHLKTEAKHSIELIQERLILLGEQFHVKTGLEILDAFPEKENSGTRVRIILPWVVESP